VFAIIEVDRTQEPLVDTPVRCACREITISWFGRSRSLFKKSPQHGIAATSYLTTANPALVYEPGDETRERDFDRERSSDEHVVSREVRAPVPYPCIRIEHPRWLAKVHGRQDRDSRANTGDRREGDSRNLPEGRTGSCRSVLLCEQFPQQTRRDEEKEGDQRPGALGDHDALLAVTAASGASGVAVAGRRLRDRYAEQGLRNVRERRRRLDRLRLNVARPSKALRRLFDALDLLGLRWRGKCWRARFSFFGHVCLAVVLLIRAPMLRARCDTEFETPWTAEPHGIRDAEISVEARDVLVVGLLEDVQNITSHEQAQVRSSAFGPFLGPATLLAWIELHGPRGTGDT
jgi:hypothetical protein